MTGPFVIPSRSNASTAGARATYRKIWNREWPHDDEYLRELAREARDAKPVGTTFSRCEFLLDLMRESHEFETTQPEPQVLEAQG